SFLATMSHELRTPLNSILGFTAIILDGMAGPLTAEQTKQLGMVQSSARHLLALINDVLDISKIEAGQLEIHPAPFDVLGSVERVMAAVRPLALQRALTLHLVAPSSLPAMESDRLRVEQVLLNLVNNAIKFTERGEVRISVELVSDADADTTPRCMARIRVADTGIGMKQEDLCRLFQPFQQLDDGLHRQHEGTGLGLAICRRLTTLLRGSIGVESTWGVGSVFTVSLPLQWGSAS
ncbi:MAG TPA: ATP-binding protein, partial [Polyangiaceae bacterium]|nr:ATP-binding protein [Polyangiaceae bacterium]